MDYLGLTECHETLAPLINFYSRVADQFSGNRVRPNVLAFRPAYTPKNYAHLLKIIWSFECPKEFATHVGANIKFPAATVSHLHAHFSIQHRTHTCDFVHVHTPSIKWLNTLWW